MQMTMLNRLCFVSVVVSALLLASGCATPTRAVAPTSAAQVGEFRHGMLNGYLAQAELPDSLALLPTPPAAGSAAQADDEATFHELAKLQATPRGALAVKDADLSFPHANEVFACALGIPISEQATPNVSMLLQRTLTDAAVATSKAKDKYQRTRPFAEYGVTSCTPAEEGYLRTNGSYPSGHSAIGWVWALALTQIAPDHADAILQRGRAFGQSRGICGVHWKSDIEAGRIIGAATFARLQSNPLFTAQLEAARAEVASERKGGAAPPGNCASEAAALATANSSAP
jgi:acid phosphatase (class A)